MLTFFFIFMAIIGLLVGRIVYLNREIAWLSAYALEKEQEAKQSWTERRRLERQREQH